MNPPVSDPADAAFDVAELFLGDDEGLLWLTLGFASLSEPLDVLHIACGKAATGVAEEDALHLERTDQDLACSGQVLTIEIRDDCVELSLTTEGRAALGLPHHTRFTFRERPELFTQAAAQLARMAACGQSCIVISDVAGDHS